MVEKWVDGSEKNGTALEFGTGFASASAFAKKKSGVGEDQEVSVLSSKTDKRTKGRVKYH